MQTKITIAVTIAIIAMLAIPAVMQNIQVQAYNTIEIAQIEARVAKVRTAETAYIQELSTQVTRLNENITNTGPIGLKIMATGIPVAYTGGQPLWTAYKALVEQYKTQAINTQDQLGFANKMETLLAFRGIIKLLEQHPDQTMPNGKLLAGVYGGMTVEEVLAPVQNLITMSRTTN